DAVRVRVELSRYRHSAARDHLGADGGPGLQLSHPGLVARVFSGPGDHERDAVDKPAIQLAAARHGSRATLAPGGPEGRFLMGPKGQFLMRAPEGRFLMRAPKTDA